MAKIDFFLVFNEIERNRVDSILNKGVERRLLPTFSSVTQHVRLVGLFILPRNSDWRTRNERDPQRELKSS